MMKSPAASIAFSDDVLASLLSSLYSPLLLLLYILIVINIFLIFHIIIIDISSNMNMSSILLSQEVAKIR
jgi:hypothetical protein